MTGLPAPPAVLPAFPFRFLPQRPPYELKPPRPPSANPTLPVAVGFLQAARQLGVTPDIITCTSGMIAWLAKWLEDDDLEPLILEKCEQDTRFPPSLGFLNMLSVALFGSSGISRPALGEYVTRLLSPMKVREELSEQLLDRLLPAQVWVPARSLGEVEHIAYVLDKSPIPVAFNTVHLRSGRPYLHINHAAREFLQVTGKDIGEVGGPQKYTPISTETVGGALWLFFYGFDNAAERRLNLCVPRIASTAGACTWKSPLTLRTVSPCSRSARRWAPRARTCTSAPAWASRPPK